MQPQTPALHPDLLSRELNRICESNLFARAGKVRQLVRWLGQRCIAGNLEKPSEYLVGVEGLGKPVDFDPSLDVSVRQLKRRMCLRLAKYYEGEGRDSRLHLVCERGFAVRFEWLPVRLLSKPCVAVMPLSGDESGFIGGSLTHALMESGRATVIGRYPASLATAQKLIESHGADYIIEGEVLRHGEMAWELTLRILEAPLCLARSGIRVLGNGDNAHDRIVEAAQQLTDGITNTSRERHASQAAGW